jgi:hypothetical protein
VQDHRVSRRDVLKTLAMGVSSTSILSVIPLQAARHVHGLVAEEKEAPGGPGYQPKFFDPHQWQTLRKLCELIIPPDEKSGGAIEANAPEFIDLLTSENPEFQTELGGGLRWLDAYCRKHYAEPFLDCSPARQKAMLDLLAYRKNSTPEISQGISFFSLLRNLTADGFYTSKIGIEDVGYVGNSAWGEFPGCPELPET